MRRRSVAKADEALEKKRVLARKRKAEVGIGVPQQEGQPYGYYASRGATSRALAHSILLCVMV